MIMRNVGSGIANIIIDYPMNAEFQVGFIEINQQPDLFISKSKI
jgi:hypothetical protein